jgi:hypothetical protein
MHHQAEFLLLIHKNLFLAGSSNGGAKFCSLFTVVFVHDAKSRGEVVVEQTKFNRKLGISCVTDI